MGGYRGLCITERRLIRISRGLRSEEQRRILLHEMCHIRSPGHGKQWQTQMLRIAAAGEDWAGKEVAAYRSSLDTWNGMVKQLKDALNDFAQQKPRLDFRRIRTAAASIMSVTYTDVAKKLPWLRAAWRNACHEADRYAALKRRFLKGG